MTSSKMSRLEETVAVEAATVVPPVSTRYAKVTATETIPLNKIAFGKKTDGIACSGVDLFSWDRSATRAKSRGTSQIVHFLLNLILMLTDEKIALDLRHSSVHHQVRKYFKATGLIDVMEFATMRHVVNQTKKMVQKYLKTNNSYGRAPDSQRSFKTLLLLLLQKQH